MNRPNSIASERNKAPILEQLKHELRDSKHLLEIGSGTGQHALFFSEHLPHLHWHTSDRPENHAGIEAWLIEAKHCNLSAPVPFTVGEDEWPISQIDAVFTANTTHIMQANEAQTMMQMVAEHLPTGGTFCQYGPFKIDGRCTTKSNEAFDLSLKEQGYGGIRDLAELQEWAEGLQLIKQIEMPANNFLLVWQKS